MNTCFPIFAWLVLASPWSFTSALNSMSYRCETRAAFSRSSTWMTRIDLSSSADEIEKESADDNRMTPSDASRRNMLQSCVMLGTAAAASVASTKSANAITLPFSSPSPPTGGYIPAKRATCYKVDSTIPPTLIPYRASREAAILKSLGAGDGTAKTPFIDEGLTLNNMMKKAVDTGTSAVGLSDVVKKRPKGFGAASFVCLGTNAGSESEGADVDLAVGLIVDMVKPRARMDTAVGFAFVPQSGQGLLDDYKSSGDEEGLVSSLERTAEVPRSVTETYLPLLRLSRSEGLSMVALAPEAEDMRVVRKDGLQNVNIERRTNYVVDAQGFIELTQDARFKLYTEYSMLKGFVPQSAEDKPGDFFSERILWDEAVATAAARWAVIRPDSLMVIVAPFDRLRYMGGVNFRLPRVCKALQKDSKVDEEAVTTILLNPTAQETLSQSRYIRLEIGTAPTNVAYQSKLADYVWFSSMPKVNTIPRMMPTQ
mmetsp:Transcript_2348/g.3447  ORF Transcript_2348/g.3447 Transcript_2348/m.3447 type:complete len:484 (+) Transcript_2348:95-1546(+)